MPDTTPQGLATAGSCYACGGMLSMYEIYKITLLSQIALSANPAADVSVQGLMTAARCYECSTFATPGQLMELALLAIIANA